MAMLADCLFIILPEFYDKNHGYELFIAWPGIEGFFGTKYYCGHDLDLAIEWANELNFERGHTPEFTATIMENFSGLSSIRFYNT